MLQFRFFFALDRVLRKEEKSNRHYYRIILSIFHYQYNFSRDRPSYIQLYIHILLLVNNLNRFVGEVLN